MTETIVVQQENPITTIVLLPIRIVVALVTCLVIAPVAFCMVKCSRMKH
jgi:hypothetical protein